MKYVGSLLYIAFIVWACNQQETKQKVLQCVVETDRWVYQNQTNCKEEWVVKIKQSGGESSRLILKCDGLREFMGNINGYWCN